MTWTKPDNEQENIFPAYTMGYAATTQEPPARARLARRSRIQEPINVYPLKEADVLVSEPVLRYAVTRNQKQPRVDELVCHGIQMLVLSFFKKLGRITYHPGTLSAQCGPY